MKRKSITIALALLLVAGMAFAGMNGNGKGEKAFGPMKGENCQLLTDDERAKVEDAKLDFEKKAIPLRADIKVLTIEVNEMIAAGKTAKDISSKLDKLNSVKADLAANKLDHQIEVRKIVGEEKYKEMQMHMRKMQHRPGGYAQKKSGKRHNGYRQNNDCRYDGQPRYQNR